MAAHSVIVGGGPAGIHALETIRALDPAARITLLSDEIPNARMALPYWVAGSASRDQMYLGAAEYYARLGVQARVGERAAALLPERNVVRLQSGEEIAYDRLLLATGSRPRRLAVPGNDLPGVTTLWTLEDAERLLAALPHQAEVCLVGAGFIGFIVLNALYKRGCRLSVVEIASHVLPRMLDAPAAAAVETWLEGRGVGLYLGTSVSRIEGEARKTVLLSDGRSLAADVVILATGVAPNVDLAGGAGLRVEHGVVVDHQCRTSAPGIFAAGDCAAGPDLLTGKPVVHAIQTTAVDHGRVAGANMAGREVAYAGSLSMNILDVAGLQCASFGRWDGTEDADTAGGAGAGILRKLVWEGDTLVGALFVGPMADVCMLNDVGMVKGFIQTRTDLGPWRRYVRENPGDLRRPYLALGVGARLVEQTTLGLPSAPRGFRCPDPAPSSDAGPHHAALVGTRGA